MDAALTAQFSHTDSLGECEGHAISWCCQFRSLLSVLRRCGVRLWPPEKALVRLGRVGV
jgi:hypothetical protein